MKKNVVNKRIDLLLEEIQSMIQEAHTLLYPLTDDEVVSKWATLLHYANIPEENHFECAFEFENVERNYYDTFLRAKFFKKIIEGYSTTPPNLNDIDTFDS